MPIFLPNSPEPENDFREAGPQRALMVERGVFQLFERGLADPPRGERGGDAAAPDLAQQRREFSRTHAASRPTPTARA